MRTPLVAAAAAAVLVMGAGPAMAADDPMDIQAKAGSWDEAAAALGTAGSLWEPQRTADLDRTRKFDVVADNLAFENGAATAGDTAVGTRYGKGKRAFWIEEKWANTGWAAEPVTSTSTAKVGKVRLRLGEPGMRYTVVATVYADCFEQPKSADPRPIPKRFRCTRGDVLEYGGTLTMRARPASTMTAPGRTSIVVRTKGLTYRELLSVARSVQQVAGAPTYPGSAQMVGMCRQMVDGTMTPDQAQAFAVSNGYTTRVGTIDGQPQAVTADYRPDRFTLETVNGVVTSCTYG